MGKFVPVTFAFIMLVCGVQIFREPNDVGRGPLVATYIFILSSYLLLWDIRLYPRSLRKLSTLCHIVIEYFIASFLFENILIDFWFPLEIMITNAPSKLAGLIESAMGTGGWQCPAWLCEFLNGDQPKLAVSYILSIFFFLAVLQTTRAVDFRELECGIGPFFSDIIFRIQRNFKRVGRSFGFGKKRRVKIRESRKCSKRSLGDKSQVSNKDPCLDDFSESGEPPDKGNSCDDELRHSFSDFEMSLNTN